MMADEFLINVLREVLPRKDHHVTVNVDRNGINMNIWPETKDAVWVNEADRENHWHCSNCGHVEGLAHKLMNYCPNCGCAITEGDE